MRRCEKRKKPMEIQGSASGYDNDPLRFFRHVITSKPIRAYVFFCS